MPAYTVWPASAKRRAARAPKPLDAPVITCRAESTPGSKTRKAEQQRPNNKDQQDGDSYENFAVVHESWVPKHAMAPLRNTVGPAI
jgi:hypothetical protein